nr:unnamed protein product [Digitaria exilis]
MGTRGARKNEVWDPDLLLLGDLLLELARLLPQRLHPFPSSSSPVSPPALTLKPPSTLPGRTDGGTGTNTLPLQTITAVRPWLLDVATDTEPSPWKPSSF